MEKKKLILTRGIQGSGKSTWARKWVEEDPEHRIRINNDDIRNMLGVYWVTSREDVVSHIKKESVNYAMQRGYDIVVDNMNLNPKEVKFWEDVVNAHNNYINSKDIIQPAWYNGNTKQNLKTSLFRQKNVFVVMQCVLILLAKK